MSLKMNPIEVCMCACKRMAGARWGCAGRGTQLTTLTSLGVYHRNCRYT